MATKEDANNATPTLSHTEEERTELYTSSAANLTRVATTNAIFNITTDIGGIYLRSHINIINGFIKIGAFNIAANISFFDMIFNKSTHRLINTSSHCSTAFNNYSGLTKEYNKYTGFSIKETEYITDAKVVNFYRAIHDVKNTFSWTKIYEEDSAFLDYTYVKSSLYENPHFEEEYYLTEAANGPDRKETWYEFPPLEYLDELLRDTIGDTLGASQEYINAQAHISALEPGMAHRNVRQIMNSSIPIAGRSIRYQHIRQLADEPKDINDAQNVGANVKVIFTRGARQTFEFFPLWGRHFYFGDSTSCYFGEKRDIYVNKRCTTTNERYALVTGKSLQHFSKKTTPAVIQYEGGLELHQIDTSDNNRPPSVVHRIAIKARSTYGEEEGIHISSKHIEISTELPNIPTDAPGNGLVAPAPVQGWNHGHCRIYVAQQSPYNTPWIYLNAPKVMTESAQLEQVGKQMLSAFDEAITLSSPNINVHATNVVRHNAPSHIFL